MRSFFILDWSVVRFLPRRAATLAGPPITGGQVDLLEGIAEHGGGDDNMSLPYVLLETVALGAHQSPQSSGVGDE